MKIVGMSDLHGGLPPKESIPECDVVCICGDITPLKIDRDKILSGIGFGREFIPGAESLNCKYVIFIAGNHDFFLNNYTHWALDDALKNTKIYYLHDNQIEFDGVSFYGTPYVENLHGWAFNIDYGNPFVHIPHQCDVLMCHTPPSNGDDLGVSLSNPNHPDGGSDLLAHELLNRDGKLLMCGHVHSGNHDLIDSSGRKMRNVSIKNEQYDVHYNPFVIEI